MEKKEFTIWKNLVSSFSSAIIIKTSLAPMERVKIFMQTDINNRRFIATTNGKEIVSYSRLVKVNPLFLIFENNKLLNHSLIPIILKNLIFK